MAETRHTPGPWTVSACEPLHRDEVLGRLQGLARLVVAVPRRRLRGRRGEPVRWADPDAEARANLRLIAAAPELLEALRAIVEWADSPQPRNVIEGLLEQARQTIAKAEGRAP